MATIFTTVLSSPLYILSPIVGIGIIGILAYVAYRASKTFSGLMRSEQKEASRVVQAQRITLQSILAEQVRLRQELQQKIAEQQAEIWEQQMLRSAAADVARGRRGAALAIEQRVEQLERTKQQTTRRTLQETLQNLQDTKIQLQETRRIVKSLRKEIKTAAALGQTRALQTLEQDVRIQRGMAAWFEHQIPLIKKETQEEVNEFKSEHKGEVTAELAERAIRKGQPRVAGQTIAQQFRVLTQDGQMLRDELRELRGVQQQAQRVGQIEEVEARRVGLEEQNLLRGTQEAVVIERLSQQLDLSIKRTYQLIEITKHKNLQNTAVSHLALVEGALDRYNRPQANIRLRIMQLQELMQLIGLTLTRLRENEFFGVVGAEQLREAFQQMESICNSEIYELRRLL